MIIKFSKIRREINERSHGKSKKLNKLKNKHGTPILKLNK